MGAPKKRTTNMQHRCVVCKPPSAHILLHSDAAWGRIALNPGSYLAEGLEALLTAMETSRATAKAAFELLHCLTSSAQLPQSDVTQNEGKLANMQAVHRCCRLLCPQYPATMTESIASGKHML